MPQPTYTAIVMTYNQENEIRDCLECIKWVDEIVIVDSHSTDRTLEICREYTDNIHVRDYQGTARTRNWAQSIATGDWILSVDPDEKWGPELCAEIREKTEAPGSCDGFDIPMKTYFAGTWLHNKYWYPRKFVRLLRRGHARHEVKEVHAMIEVDGETGELENPIDHYPYPDIATYFDKMNRYTSWEALDMYKRGVKLTWWDFPVKWIARLLLIPFRMFIKMEGYRTGLPGLVLSFLVSVYTFVLFAKYWEMTRQEGKPDYLMERRLKALEGTEKADEDEAETDG